MVIWYVYVTPRGERDIVTQNLIYAIQELGHGIEIQHYIPFSEPDFSFLPIDKPVVFHGAIGVVRKFLDSKGKARPFAWFDFELLTCHNYYTYWGDFIAQNPYGFYTLGEIKRLQNWLYGTYGRNDTIFIRPDTNDKVFNGEKVHRKSLEAFMNWNDHAFMSTLCVVAKPVKFLTEWRLIVADKKAVAGSQYRDGSCICSDPYCPKEVMDFAEKVASVWSPHPVYCLDIGLTDEGYKVVECGSVNCAGYYQCEIRPIVDAMSRIAEREYG